MTATDTPSEPATLSTLDARLGALIVGESSINRATLAEMGAQVNRQPIEARQLSGREADQTLLDTLTFPASALKRFLGNAQASSDNSANLLFELASLRSVQAGPLLVALPDTGADEALGKLDGLLRAAQRANPNQAGHVEGLPPWVDAPHSRSLAAAGFGLQVYGYYSAITALVEALKSGDIAQTLNAGAELLAELASTALELALESLGKRLLEKGAQLFQGFSASSLGKLLCRGAGLFALVLTLPLDIRNAVLSLKEAARARGKEAMDHYVNAGLSITSAALGVVLGIAALAGFSQAGPLGLAAAAVLIIGAQVYSAARQVDEIDDYIELSSHERLRAGWFLFWGMALDEPVRERYAVARMDAMRAAHLKTQAEQWLKGALKGTVQAVVNGKYEVRLSPARHWKYRWDASGGELPYVETTEPGVHDEDDVIDASGSRVDQLPGSVQGAASSQAGVLWQLGGGNDTVRGVADAANIFRFGAGHKQLTGGEGDDQFLFDLPAGTFGGTAHPVRASELRGRGGSDTLHLVNQTSYPEDTLGFAIDLYQGTVRARTGAGQSEAPLALSLDSIENVSTPSGVASHVKGTAAANVVIAWGDNDRIETGDANDTILVQGTRAWVDGGAGQDRYVIASNRGTVTLHEQDWNEGTQVEMRWEAACICRWVIQDCALVIVTLRGDDGELAERVLRLEALYAWVDGKRVLKNNLVRFVTADGYTLMPVLAAELAGTEDVVVKVGACAMGPDVPVENLLGTGEFKVPVGVASRCFVARGAAHKTVRVGLKSDVTACTLYVDYTWAEMVEVEATYHVSCRAHGAFDELTYGNVALTLVFHDGGRLVLANYASDRAPVRSNVVGGILANRLRLDCRVVLIFRDGVSCRLDPVPQHYLQDRVAPGLKTVDGRAALVSRAGVYPFVRPPASKSIQLQSVSQRIVIPAPPHHQHYVLAGRSSVYEVVTSAGATLHLSTPAALLKRADASCWRLYTDELEPSQIRLEGDRLCLDSVTVYLPSVSDPGVPLEQVSIHSAGGDVYQVRQDFQAVCLSQLHLACATVDEAWTELRRRRQQAPLMARRLWLTGIGLAGDARSVIFYDTVDDRWGLTADPARRLAHSALVMRTAGGAHAETSRP
ncbi:MAG: hypothetical protein GAK37_02404 [Pseudomonas sp.]|nr:MAG: hypothetical protein GAK37_02404 [Pseudomonas sp.]